MPRLLIDLVKQRSLAKLFWKQGQRVLFAIQQPVIELAGEIDTDSLKSRIPSLLRPGSVKDHLSGIWIKSGSIFAVDTIKRIHRVARKQEMDIDFWEDYFRRYVNERSLLKIAAKTGIIIDTQTQIVNNLIDMILEEGFQNGLGIPEIQRQMRDKLTEGLTEINKYQAERIARTEVIGASNTGSFEGAKESGVALGKEWMTSGLPGIRASHLEYEGRGVVAMDHNYAPGLQYPGDPEGSAEEIINCYVGETNINSYIVKGQRSYYSGKIVEIITEGGKSLSVTPNHNILTSNGFISARNLAKGNNLICNPTNLNIISRIKNYINKKKTFAANIFCSLSNLWGIENMMIRTLDFNGDGRFMNKDIDIVDPNRGLTFNNKIIAQDFGKLGFKHSRTKTSLIKTFCSFHFGFDGMVSSSNGLMRFLNLFIPFIKRHSRPFKFFSIGMSPKINTSIYKMAHEGNPDYTGFISDLLHANSRLISFDKVKEIRNINGFHGYVYDFTSLTGTNIANNIYTSNCRCTIGYQVD